MTQAQASVRQLERSVGFVEPDQRIWREFLQDCEHDFYQTPEYLRFSGKHEEGRPAAFIATLGKAGVLIPLLFRTLPKDLTQGSTLWDASSPYGYPGVLTKPSTTASDAKQMFAAFREAAKDHKLISCFVRGHPLQETPYEVLADFATIVDHGESVFVDLTLSDDELKKGVRKTHRHEIRKLRSAGFSIALDRWDMLDDFQRLYQFSMRHVGAARQYLFDRRYFEDLKEALGECLHLCMVKAPNGTAAAGGIFIKCGPTVQYHLSGTNPEFRRLAPSKLMLDFMCDWSKAQGGTRFHLGGGVGNCHDSLFKFKAGFSDARARFRTLQFVFDAQQYEALSRRRDLEGETRAGFFPAYRAPSEDGAAAGIPHRCLGKCFGSCETDA